MNKLMSWIFIGALLGVPASVLAADGVGAGIVKGTITIGGKPAKDAVVSIEGLSQDQIKTKMAHSKRQTKIIDQRNLKFIPTVVAIMAGETIDFPNNDKS
jgi:plastocyanin